MSMYFSDYFQIDTEVLKEYGAIIKKSNAHIIQKEFYD